jgi:hypothetical protein
MLPRLTFLRELEEGVLQNHQNIPKRLTKFLGCHRPDFPCLLNQDFRFSFERSDSLSTGFFKIFQFSVGSDGTGDLLPRHGTESDLGTGT